MAATAAQLRDGFDDSWLKQGVHHETTEYTGTHSIECFVIRRGVCVARGDPFFEFVE